MKLINRLKVFEHKYVFLRWATAAEFGKIIYVGEDFVEFLVLNPETMEYGDKILINSQLILEVMVSGYEISRLLAELSVNVESSLDIGNTSN